MNGAERLCDTLLACDVDVCFANPGTSEMHFVAALDRRPRMRCILGLCESVVTGAADGYGRMADRPAATLLHLGPGLANGLANLHNAKRARTPIINIVGDHASYHAERDPPLASDIDSLARPMSHWVGRVSGAGDIEAKTVAAYRAAVAGPGVATLIVPADAAWEELPALCVEPRHCPEADPIAPDALNKAVQLMRSERKCALILGGRALRTDALAVAGRIADATGARLLAQTTNGRIERGIGRIPVEKIPYPVEAARSALAAFDALVIVGATIPVAFFAYPGDSGLLIREDCAVVELTPPQDEVKQLLEALSDELDARSAPRQAVVRPGVMDQSLGDGRLTDDTVCLAVAQMMPEDAIVCDEGITSSRSFFRYSQQSPRHDYLQITGGAIGIGIPLATGAAIACPARKVIDLQADGSGMYTIQGLWTQARENLDVVTIVFANRAYAILRGEMSHLGAGALGRSAERMLRIDQPILDWVAMANGMGVEAGRAETMLQFAKLLKGALSRRGPFVIEAVL